MLGLAGCTVKSLNTEPVLTQTLMCRCGSKINQDGIGKKIPNKTVSYNSEASKMDDPDKEAKGLFPKKALES